MQRQNADAGEAGSKKKSMFADMGSWVLIWREKEEEARGPKQENKVQNISLSLHNVVVVRCSVLSGLAIGSLLYLVRCSLYCYYYYCLFVL